MRFRIDPFRSLLETGLQSSGKRSESFRKRMDNINWVNALDISGLASGQRERQIQIALTEAQESLYVRYPGKESIQTRRRSNPNPRDFRPRLERSDGSSSPDLSFEALWDPLFNNLEPLSSKLEPERAKEPELVLALGVLFYRMAFMLDHHLEERRTFRVKTIEHGQVAAISEVRLEPFWTYKPPRDLISTIGRIVPDWGGMSLEAFLHYHDILAWNEDCKYYLKKAQLERGTGRVNTLLTHVHVIGFIMGAVKPSALLSGFARQRGVSPAGEDEVIQICSNFIKS
jgi:hypothetical protein